MVFSVHKLLCAKSFKLSPVVKLLFFIEGGKGVLGGKGTLQRKKEKEIKFRITKTITTTENNKNNEC